MDRTIRAARRSELPQIYDLLERAFPEASRPLFVAQTEQDSTFRFRHARVAIDNGRIAAYVRIFARRMLVGGIPVAAGGIGAVATRPDVRGRGIATALLRDAIEVMRRERMALSFLFTGITGFYEPLGFRIVREPQFEVSARDAASIAHTDLYDVRPLTDRDVPALLRIYSAAIAGSTGAVVRTRRTWRDAHQWLGETPDSGFVAEHNGLPVAYLRSRCRTSGHQILEAEHHPKHADAIAQLLAAAGRLALAHGEPIIALVPGDHALATALRTLRSARETTHVPYPMMVLRLDPSLPRNDGLPLHFWNSDRI